MKIHDENSKPIRWNPVWDKIDTILLDMDGTLLDKHFDDYFWEHYVPEIFAKKNDLTPLEARKELLARYKSIEGTLAWTDLDYWSEKLGLDIPALKLKINHLIQVHPFVIDFLQFSRNLNKKVHLVTNAHSKTLDIKMRKTELGSYFDRIVCSQDIGLPKEEPRFWERLESLLGFDKQRTLLADDNENVLQAAKAYGMGVLIFVARPSSRAQVHYSDQFSSIVYFKELIV
ncbi:MAG: HAD-IA family hydrolase [Deltaproteobacteria bacterium]|nr:MAG: HAD-IA family hydrolase [Deltaproteobacteria bacterium]